MSYLTARPSRDLVTAGRQTITADWWRDRKGLYEVYVSALVEEEISGGDAEVAAQRLQAIAGIPSLATTKEAQALAEALLRTRAVSSQ